MGEGEKYKTRRYRTQERCSRKCKTAEEKGGGGRDNSVS